MNLSQTEIEILVRVVLDRLEAQSLRTEKTIGNPPSTTWLEEPVVTLETLRRCKPKKGQVLEVAAAAVITPAAADELKDLGVEVKRTSSSDTTTVTVFATSEPPAVMLSKVHQSLTANEKIICRCERAYELAALAAQESTVVHLATAGDLQTAVEQASPDVIVLDATSWGYASAKRLGQRWSRLLGDRS